MDKVNLSAIKEHVSVQYGDLTGVIQIDGHSNVSSLYDLCNANNFPTDDIFIVGFGFGESTINGIGQRDTTTCTILYVLKSKRGSNFEEIQKTINENGKLKVKKKNIELKYSDIGKYIKRFEFLAFTEMAKNIDSIEIDETGNDE